MKAKPLGGPDDYFLDLLDCILPGRNGPLIVLQAYFDASARPSGLFCVAGYAFAKPQAKKFDKEWWKVFGEYDGCHMKELAHCQGRFSGIDHIKAGKLQKAGVEVIKRRISFGVVISCDVNEVGECLPSWIDGFQHAFPLCCHLVMSKLGDMVEESNSADEVAYFFESGDEYSPAAHRFMERTDDCPELKKSYRHASHSFIAKDKARPLQAADMLAWEWTKYMDETRTQKKRPMRKSLAALMGNNGQFDSRYGGHHITGEPLQKYMKQVANLGLMQIAEDVIPKIGQPSSGPKKRGGA